MDEAPLLKKTYSDIIESINVITSKGEGNFALKFSGLICLDVLEKLNIAHNTLLKDITDVETGGTSAEVIAKIMASKGIQMSDSQV